MVILEVNLIQAQSLTNKDLIDKSDPFVKLYTCNLHSMMQINKVIVFINVPWWYLAFYTMMSPFITERTKSKSVFASPTRTSKTLFISEFTIDDPVAVVTVNPCTKQTMEIIINYVKEIGK
ncbi:unnamed protein product [Lactuca virosa]|uniref:C2 domain-containing protein n=1 Tax=Lactuca virosa TaxID=75947 RepID=A0AAU9LT06_9ASTR|nr:unnamed protein product [Lactuca virosa]